ncbi:MAG TPA: BadF/BadG/BcrA/BcrD ATPase family protein, partial [Ktedonobacterales bacterium]
MQCVLAVDGGNTKTIAAIAAVDGSVLGIGHAGCSDVYNAHPDDGSSDAAAMARRNAERATLAALAQAQAAPSDLLVGVFNMAGADWPEDFAFWQAVAAVRGFGRTVIVQNDALGVLYLGAPDAVGVSIVAGTGAATGARGADGRTWHSSFWQDEAQGSAQLGQKTLFAVYRSALGIAPATSLTARVLAYLKVVSVEEALRLFTNRQRPAPINVDRLTPILLDEAHAGDAVALRVVREHGAALGDFALAGARMVGLEGTPFPLVLAGGVFRHPTTVLEDAIVARVRSVWPEIRPIRSRAEPIVGVLIEALGAA